MPETVCRTIHGVEYKSLSTLNGGRYIVEYILAAGGQGVTLVARDTCLCDNRVLIKAPLYGSEQLGLGDYGFDGVKADRDLAILDQEVPTILELNQRVQNVPRLLDIFFDENAQLIGEHPLLGSGGETWEIQSGDDLAGDNFLVYEFLSAGAKARATTLSDMIEEKGALDERYVLRMAWQIADVLAELHDQQDADPTNSKGDDNHDDDQPKPKKYFYIYKDLKPDNILVTGDRHFFLIDFGGVARCNVSFEKGKVNFMVGEQSGASTTGYAPPEQYETPENLDQRFDIFSLGATIFQALSSVSPVQLMQDPMNLNSAPDFDPRNLEKKVPKYQPHSLVQGIVYNATRAESKFRYPSIQQMRVDIIRALEEE